MKHRQFRFFSLPAQLYAVLAGTVLFVAAAFFGISTIFISDVIHAKAELSIQRELELVVNNFHSLISSVDDFSISFSIDSGIEDILRTQSSLPADTADAYNVKKGLTHHLTYLGAGSTSFVSADVMFRDGQLAYVSEFTPYTAWQALDMGAIEETRVTHHPVWTAPQKLRSNTLQDKSVFTVYKSVFDLDSAVYIGTILIYVGERSFSDVLNTAASQHTSFYLLSGDTILSSADQAESYRQFSDVIGCTDPSFSVTDSYNGQIVSCTGGDQILYRQPLGIENWYVVSMMPLTYLNAEISSLIVSIFMVCFCALLLTFIAAAVLSRRILHPVERLLHSVEAIPLRDGIPLLPQDTIAQHSHMTSQNLDLMTEKIHQLIEQLYLDQKQRNKLNFRVMQEQIKPHFLYNALETASSLIYLGMEQEAGAYIHQLSVFYRLSLSAGQDIIPLSQELQLTQAYLDIQKTRYCEFFDYRISSSAITIFAPSSKKKHPSL